MLRLSTRSNVREVERTLDDLGKKQVPFAVSKALNTTATDFQKDQRSSMASRFSLRRRSWAERSIKIGKGDWATKKSLRAVVRVETPGDKSRSDILTQHEDGGTKEPFSGRSLAIPGPALGGGKRVVPTGKRPKAFNFQLHGSGPGGEVYKGANRTIMIRKPDGTGGIYQRTGRETKSGKTAGRRKMMDGRDRNLKVLYRFTTSARLDQRLHFEKTAEGTAKARFARNFEEALKQAIATGMTKDAARRTARADTR